MPTKVKVTGVDIFVGDNNSFAQELINDCNGGRKGANRKVSATSAHGLVFASKNPDFKNTLDNFYYNLPDGSLLFSWVMRTKPIELAAQASISSAVGWIIAPSWLNCEPSTASARNIRASEGAHETKRYN